VLHHLAGGEGGMRHQLDHIGPGIQAWWNDLGRPEITPEVIDRLVEAFDQGEKRSVQELAAERDVLLVALLDRLARTRRELASG
jgi:hypothetical protein